MTDQLHVVLTPGVDFGRWRKYHSAIRVKSDTVE